MFYRILFYLEIASLGVAATAAAQPFVEVDVNLKPLVSSSASWGDYDYDGDLDLLLSGSMGKYNGSISRLYRNDTGGVFTEAFNFPYPTADAAAWGDYDNDGDLDLVFSGLKSRLFRNDGATFTEVDAGLKRADSGAVAWGDYDNDGDLDLVLTGKDQHRKPVTYLYRNDSAIANAPPTLPTSLTVTAATAGSVILSWETATDDTTPASALSYNVRVGTRPGGMDILAPMALMDEAQHGRRQVIAYGNAGQRTNLTLHGLSPNTEYYWSVQAVDNCFAGSSFATEKRFNATTVAVEEETPRSPTVLLDVNYPNPFQAQTTIRYSLPQATHVRLVVFDAMGRRVQVPIDGMQALGWHEVVIEAYGLPSGVYFYRLEAGSFQKTGQMLLVR